MDRLKHYLLHSRLPIRFLAFLGVTALTVVIVWTLSYLLLPEGILRNRSVGQILAGNDLAADSILVEWLRIFAVNLGVFFFLVVAPNLMRTENDYPLGYISVIILASFYSVTLGTGSFTLSEGGKLSPSLTILEHSGPYEIIAYILATTATYSIARFRLKGRWPKQTIEAIISDQTFRLAPEQWAGLVIAIIILLISNAWKAYRIMLYFIK